MMNNTTDTIILPPERLPSWLTTVFGTYLTTAAVVGGLANGMSLYVFLTNKHLRSPTNAFIIALLTCDFLMCIVGIPFPASSNFAGRWLYGWNGCVFHGFSVYVLGLSNLYILCAISVDRYIVIAKPLQASKINFRVVGISIFMCYFFGTLWSCMPFFGWSSYVFEGAGLSCAISYDYTDPLAFSYNIAILINCFLLPICVMLYCYYFVYMTVRNMARTKVFDEKSAVARRNLRIEKKMAKTIILMIGVFLFAWTPYAITSFYVAFGFGSLPVIVATIPSFFAKSASVWNPMIYVFTNKQFRTALYKAIPCSSIREKLARREEEKETKSAKSGDSGGISKTSASQVKTSKVQTGNKRTGVAPVLLSIDEDAENTIIEHLQFEESVNEDKVEMKNLRKETKMHREEVVHVDDTEMKNLPKETNRNKRKVSVRNLHLEDSLNHDNTEMKDLRETHTGREEITIADNSQAAECDTNADKTNMKDVREKTSQKDEHVTLVKNFLLEECENADQTSIKDIKEIQMSEDEEASVVEILKLKESVNEDKMKMKNSKKETNADRGEDRNNENAHIKESVNADNTGMTVVEI